MLETDTQGHTNNMVMLKVWTLERFPFQKAYHYAACTTELSVIVSVHLIC